MKTNQVLSTSLTSASFSSSSEACFSYFVSLGRFTEVSFLVFPWVFPYSHINMEVQTPTKIPQFFPYSHIFRWVFPWVFRFSQQKSQEFPSTPSVSFRHCGQQAGRPCSPAAHHQHPALAQLGPRAGVLNGLETRDLV